MLLLQFKVPLFDPYNPNPDYSKWTNHPSAAQLIVYMVQSMYKTASLLRAVGAPEDLPLTCFGLRAAFTEGLLYRLSLTLGEWIRIGNDV